MENVESFNKKIPDRGHWLRSDILIVNFEYISYIFVAFLLLNLKK